MVHFQHNPELKCKTCGAPHMRRLHLRGFLVKRLLAFFGYFPWECPVCRIPLYIRERWMTHRTNQGD